MSSAKRRSEAVEPGPETSKKPRTTLIRRIAVDHSKPVASTLRISSGGRVQRKKLQVDVETSVHQTSNAPNNAVDELSSREPLASSVDVEFTADPLLEIEEVGLNVTKKEAVKERKVRSGASKLQDWLRFRDTCLMELIRNYGLADYAGVSDCATCHKRSGKFRCLDCYPHSPLRCAECLVKIHKENPLHRIEAWNGAFFEKVQLKDLGLRVQLGHGGRPCPLSMSGSTDFVVLHSNGVHSVAVDFCDCKLVDDSSTPLYVQVLRMGWFPATFERPKTAFTFDLLNLFHKVTLQGKTTLYDFYNTITQLTDGLQLDKKTERYREFQRIFRIWRHLQALKHAGRGHDPAGPSATSRGELVLECPACPHPGKNLPENWEDGTSDNRFLYTLFLAVDANFKLKQKDRQINDFELAPGWGCYVEPSEYKRHLAGSRDEQEINSCSSDHNAVARANTSVPGYAVNGVAIGICSRHSFVRGNGAVDLEKGEKFCSMDYMVLSALAGISIPRIVISYDIGCQWSRNLHRRMAKYDERLQIQDDIELEIGIPNWHVNGHGKYCRDNYSLNYIPGVGRTCGEDVEITWSQTNALAPSTREMGSGARRETLNDQWNGWNFRKMVGFRPLFLKRFKEAEIMRKKYSDIFGTFSETFKPSTLAVWTKMVEDWLSDRTKPNPYEEPENLTTVQDVRLELAKEDAEVMNRDVPVRHSTSLTEFLMKGLDLEEQQRILSDDVAQMKAKLSSKESADLQERRNTLHRQIKQWREVQLAYMPFVGSLLPASSSSIIGSTADDPHTCDCPEEALLYLPSNIPAPLRDSIKDIASKEYRLRKAQADESLEKIRRGRRMITGLTQFKKLNICGAGNKPNTRMRGLYDRLQKRIRRAASCYRAARDALYRFEPDGGTWKDRFQMLDISKDIRGLGKQPDDPAHLKKGRFEQSWIWTVAQSEGREAVEEEFDEIMRAEWARTRARRDRWEEEYALVVEEMRRTVVFLNWKASWWRIQGRRKSSATGDYSIISGLTAYAERQAHLLERLASSCMKTWQPALSAAGITVDWGIQHSSIPIDGSCQSEGNDNEEDSDSETDD